ncbi:MAG: DUF488 domain-containing protein [Hyphomonadaceae bacterium]|nr:DUF488 domain-containing protein [Hyphomonadaceae bacterium]
MTSSQVLTYTIGFTESSAEGFFKRLRAAGVRRLLDVRLNNTSQLSGFAKSKDLKFFLSEIASIDYVHMPLLAPTEDILTEYKKNKGDWRVYREKFLALMARRSIETSIAPGDLDASCLLCSEHLPHNCHRSLVCEYLNDKWDSALNVRHL